MYCTVLYWLGLLDLLRLLALLPLTISARMDHRIKASIIPAWFILISLKVDFYQLYYTAKVQKSQLRRRTKQVSMNGMYQRLCRRGAHWAPVFVRCLGSSDEALCLGRRRPMAAPTRWERAKTPGCVFAAGGNIYPCFFRFSELLARTAEVIWMKSLTYFFTFSPLR